MLWFFQFVLVMSCIDVTNSENDEPRWATALGWCISMSVLIWVPIVALYRLNHSVGTTWKEVCCTNHTFLTYFEFAIEC